MGKRYERLTHPMIREGDGFRQASWDEALTAAAAGLQQVKDEHGPTSFGMFSCSKSTNEMNFLAQKFGRVVMGSNNLDSCNRT